VCTDAGPGPGRPFPLRNCGDRVLADGRCRQPSILEGYACKDGLARQRIHLMMRRAEVTRLAER
jgi:hypothetical protein